VFKHGEVSRATVETAVRERMTRMRTRQLDFLQVSPPFLTYSPFWVTSHLSPFLSNLSSSDTTPAPQLLPVQFYWQDYSNKGYMTSLRYLQDMQRDGHIRALGLVNFDAVRTDEICTQLGPGSIVSNQVQVCVHTSAANILSVATRPTAGRKEGKKTSDAHPFLMIQFSLIDTRPLHGMADVCEKHNIKLLTYGTFVRISLYSYRLPAIFFSSLNSWSSASHFPSGQCGGFLADAWLDRPEPDPYSGALTPSQRKVS
jgi:aryl-alcohol dehydrogenase-like predicted oxidoreductase